MYFTAERITRILNELSSYVHPESEQVTHYKIKKGNVENGQQIDIDTSEWDDFMPDDRWGGKDQHYWFRKDVRIPEKFNGCTVVYEVKTGREGQWDGLNPQFLIYVNGKLVQGLDINHREIILCENANAREVYHIALNAYAGMIEGLVEFHTTISTLDREVEKLYYDIKVPLDVAVLLDEEDKKRIGILKYLDEAVNILDLRRPGSDAFKQSVREAGSFLQKEFYENYCGGEDVTAYCVGHTHIDVAWLWTVAQTREKAARSFSTVLNLMKEYPEYIFMSSQPQLYKFIKQDQPELYEEIKQSIRDGKWEPEGAMWLEADCNLSSGESLVRQILFGTRFFEQEFGVKNKILWLPDVFGYSAALPQILKKSGIDYFMTTKISWNEYNMMPYDTFMWKGMDGTEVLTHFISTTDYQVPRKSHNTTYVGHLIPKQVMGAWQRYQQKYLSDDVLICYGFGDGGGGPTKEMLENARRMEKGIPGCPKVKLSKSLDFFEKIEKSIEGNTKLPKWVGELYLEYHRGTYTSMARNKKFNRKSEFLYQDTELFSSISQNTIDGEYPQEQLNEGWETILLNQFHDILPGSSIREVYEDSKNDYVKVLEKGQNLLGNVLDQMAHSIALEHTSVIVFNQLSFIREDVVQLDLPSEYTDAQVTDDTGRIIPSQIVSDGTGKQLFFYAQGVPAKGYKAFKIENKGNTHIKDDIQQVKPFNGQLSNSFFDIELDHTGNIISIYDKINQRQVLKPGQNANVLQAFEDKPHNYDAWDINIYYQEKMWEINEVESMELIQDGPVMKCLRIKKKFMDSLLVQDICIYHDIPKIDFKTWIDWKEKQVLVKAAFPIDVHADKATYEIQYGNVERPTHWNTSWDYARFEVCAHKWADLSEENYGVSLLNDCKYGYDIKDGVMRLTLLKSATHPNEDADREVHEFTYSLYPHSGDWKEAETVQMAYSLNCPMYAKMEEAHSGNLPQALSFVALDQENVIVEVVKKAEDSNDIVIRLYECYNKRTVVNLTCFKEILQAWECDMMEHNLNELEIQENKFSFLIKPYEIKTFKIKIR